MITLNGKAMPWTLYVGTKAASATGPIIIYWHGTGTMAAADVGWGIGQAAISEVQSKGGVVAAAESTSNTGTTTGNNVCTPATSTMPTSSSRARSNR